MAEARIAVVADLSDITDKFAQLRGQMDSLAGKASESSTKLAEATKPLSERLTALGTGATALVSGAAAASGALITVLTKNAGQYAEQVTQIKQQTGLTSETVQVMGVALNRAGLGLENLLPAFRKLSSEMVNLEAGKKQATAVFESIGIAADDLKGKNPDQVFRLVAEKLATMDEGFARTNASAELFGRSGLKFIPVLADAGGGFDQVAETARHMGAVLDDVRLAKLAAMDDKFDDLRKTTSAMGVSFGANFSQPMTQALDLIMSVLNRVTAAVTALPQPLVTSFGVLAVGGAAIAPALIGLASFVKAIEVLTPLVTALYALILAHPFVAIGAAVVAVATLIIANWGAISTATSSAWNGIKGFLAGVWEELKGTAIVQWTELKVFVTQTLGGMVNDIGNWLGPRLKAAMDLALAPIKSTYDAFAWLRDKVTGHSEIPDMVQEIGEHMALLDVRMGSPARIATTNTLRTFRDFRLSSDQIIGEIASVAVSTWGQVTNTISGALAKNMIQGNDWAKTFQSLGQTVLASFLNLAIQMGTQEAIIFAKRLLGYTADATAHETAETAKTAVTGVQEGARLAITMATNKASMAATIAGLATMGAVGEAALGVLEAVILAVGAVFEAIAAGLALSGIGAIFAPAFAEAGVAAMTVGQAGLLVGAGAIQAAIGGAIVTATTALATPFASGGIVTGPTLALIGEAGHTETVLPYDVRDQGAGGRQTINVYLDSDAIMRAMAKGMPRYLEVRGVRS